VTPQGDNETVLYEVNLDADAAIEQPFDTWLRDHIADVLQFEGFVSAEILDNDEPAEGRIRRTVQYRLRDRAALDAYLRDHAPRMRRDGVEKFGDRYTAERRVLSHREEFVRGAFSTDNCLNCGEVLRGQHCAHCGQRAKVRVLSLGALLGDLFKDLTEFDSRLWRTLKPLAFRPGTLTVEFLRGRRTHYSPPFRMYLVLSLVFFLLTSGGAGSPGDALQFQVGGDGDGGTNITLDDAAEAPAVGANPAPGIDDDRQRIIEKLAQFVPEKDRERVRRELTSEFGQMSAEQIAPIERLADDPCGPGNFSFDFGPGMQKYEDRARDACRKIAADGKGFGRAVLDNVPTMMFVFLPLIALVMFVLYLGSGRYYVEHLLFFVHVHAFFFLGGIAILVLDYLSRWLAGTAVASPIGAAEGLLTFAFMVYLPYYLYRAMRRVYGQRRVVTLIKFFLLLVGYLLFLTLTLVGLVAYTALTL
jgi:hypothetical protein